MITVCVVGGYQRSGTRQLTDILNQHPDIQISGEIGRHSFVKIRRAVKRLRSFHAKHGGELNARLDVQLAVATSALYAKYPKNIQLKGSGSVVGFKTPRSEWYSDQIADIFSSNSTKKVFLFCNRDFRDVFLSLKTLGWKMEIESFVRFYKRSLRSLIEMSRSESVIKEWDINIVSLDQFLSADEKGEWIQQKIFQPLNVIVSARDAMQFFQNTTNRNSTARATGKPREVVFAESDWNYCLQDAELWQLLGKLAEIYPGQGFNTLEAFS